MALRPEAHDIAMTDLFSLLQKFHDDYQANIYPDLGDPFTVALFKHLSCSSLSKLVFRGRSN